MSIMGSDQSKPNAATDTSEHPQPLEKASTLTEQHDRIPPSDPESVEADPSIPQADHSIDRAVPALDSSDSIEVSSVSLKDAAAQEPLDATATTSAETTPPKAPSDRTATEAVAAPAEDQEATSVVVSRALDGIAQDDDVKENVVIDAAAEEDDFVPPDMEHIVATGSSESAAQSMESLREAARKAREAAGVPREALPPGFEDEAPVQVPVPPASEEEEGGPLDSIDEAVRKAKEASGMAEPLSANAQRQRSEADSQANVPDKESPDVPTQEGIAVSNNSSSESDDDSDSESESSSASDSSDDDDDENEEDKGASEARLVTGIDGDGDDYDDEGGGTAAEAPATKNEIVAPEVEVPAIQTLTPEDLAIVRPLGHIHSIVDSVVVVAQDVTTRQVENGEFKGKGKDRALAAPVDSTGRSGEEDSGEYSVLDTGSLLCFEDGKVLGLVFETFGSVRAPLYSIRYPSMAAIDKKVAQVGKPVLYLPNASTYVLTRVLKAMKGSDASNLYDEEVADDEVDYSDDEAEAEAKRRAKENKRARQDPGGNERPGKKVKGRQQGQQQQQQAKGGMNRGQRGPHAVSAGPTNLALPPRPPPSSLPARPNFDIDAPHGTGPGMAAGGSGGRAILSYDDAGAGGDAGSAAAVALMPSAGLGPDAGTARGSLPAARGGPASVARGRGRAIAGLPPRPASGLPASPRSNGSSPIVQQGQGSPPFRHSPSAMAAPRFGSPGGAPASAAIAQSASGGGPHQSPSYPQHLAHSHLAAGPAAQGPYGLGVDGAGGHYNPHFAGYWAQQQQQQQQQPPWSGHQPLPAASSGGAAYGQAYPGYPSATVYPQQPPQQQSPKPYQPHQYPSSHHHHQQPQQQQQQPYQPTGPAGPAASAGAQQQNGAGSLYYGGHNPSYGMHYGGVGGGAGPGAFAGYGYAGYGGSAGYAGVGVDPTVSHGPASPNTGTNASAAGSYDPKQPSYPGYGAHADYPPPPPPPQQQQQQ